MTTVGIIGFGSFGRFLAEKLDAWCAVKVYSSSGKANPWQTTLPEVGRCEFVIPAIPLSAYNRVLKDLQPHLNPKTTIVDVASVKSIPATIIRERLPGQRLVVTHPLFGPESAARSLEGHTIVLCPEHSDDSQYQKVKSFSRSIGLHVVEMSEEEHDREMALVHALTFFIAHSLKDMKLHDQQLSTPSFKKLLQLAELEKHHSFELFKTIQAGNPFAGQIREEFIRELQELNRRIDSDE